MLNNIINYLLKNRLITILFLFIILLGGSITSPFGEEDQLLPFYPVSVDAIPDIGENQQIVFTEWKGASPQDIQDQVSYPLTTWLLGIPGVKTIRSTSVFGFSNIYIIFDEEVDFYWSRTRILERINSVPANLLPTGVKPVLGPDATALGQVFWYTLEGRDKEGNPTGGWDLHEIRTVQDFYLKYALNTVKGVSEVASIGGYVKEYQVDVDPKALQIYNIPIDKVIKAVQKSNKDVGAKTIEINQVEYFVRGLGYIEKIEDLEDIVVAVTNNVPIYIKDIAKVSLGPATRRGLLDKGGAEVVGGVVVARYGANPMETITQVKKKINEISAGLPKKTLQNGVESQLTVVPFYDRSELIQETLGTLEEALFLEILIAVLVVIVLLYSIGISVLVSSLLPLAILMVFMAMKYFDVSANIVALSGIAIAIGTMVDLSIILSENVVQQMKIKTAEQSLLSTVYKAVKEVSHAIVTAVSTTIVSFTPIFALQAAEGKLFTPLALTKSFALIASVLVALFILPTLIYYFYSFNERFQGLFKKYIPSSFSDKRKKWVRPASVILISCIVTFYLTKLWLPLGASQSFLINYLGVVCIVGVIIVFFLLLLKEYERILRWCLDNRKTFLLIPTFLLVMGINIWIGFDTTFSFIPKLVDPLGYNIKSNFIWSKLAHTFPGIGKEFMPSLDEGSFLLMPTTMPHAGVEYNKKVLKQLDMAVQQIPEIKQVVGKAGRVESALDPAPLSMFENLINYKPEYILNEKGYRQRFKTDDDGNFITKEGKAFSQKEALQMQLHATDLVEDEDGNYFRNWRPHIHSTDDIWNEILAVIKIPGLTSAPKLQPIETRLIMLQTGMRAPMGIKIYGNSLETIEAFGKSLEQIIKEVPYVSKGSVFADRVVGKPYLNLRINRQKIARYGILISDVQQVIETAIGGKVITSTIEGRERFPVRVRYPRVYRESPKALEDVLISAPNNIQIPLKEIVDFEYQKGPQAIKTENTFLVSYVLFDKVSSIDEVEVVDQVKSKIEHEIEAGNLVVPEQVTYQLTGNYENQLRASKRLSLIVPLVLMCVFVIIYFQFKSVALTGMIFTGIGVAFSGAFIMLWLYGQPWFADFSFFGSNMRDVFQVETTYLSVAVWVGFIALFGIATDDGVLMGTYLTQIFEKKNPTSIDEIKKMVITAGKKRIRPAVMTSVTTIIALLPILTSNGKGADIMIPMAIPSFGGMLVATITYFIVPVLYAYWQEKKWLNHKK